ncbi:phage baseplate assembly protein V [Teredinibacter purpureus]|uniref:phage baseplate assembly protein V n=1 Tax=Teredinibacter purpureus TaxID=2731756 RepID=UPI000697A8C1|nr:phage baseplate assembly protein V [Teredinibacter purpureus]
MDLERTVAHLMQKIERHHHGKYRGFVVDNEDPECLGRITVTVPSVTGTIVSGWAAPCFPYGGSANQGLLFMPEKESGVWVEYEGGDIDFPVWVGTFWSAPDDENELPLVYDIDGEDSDEVQNPPTRKIIRTRKGHSIQFEDKDDEELLLILQRNGDDKRNLITMTADGVVIRQQIEDGKINQITLTDSGITMTDVTENSIQMTDSAFNIMSKVAFTLDASGQNVVIKAAAVDITDS